MANAERAIAAQTSAQTVAPRPVATQYRFEPFVANWMLLALAFLILLAVRRSYKRSTREIRPEYKMVLGFIRLSAFGLLFFCLLRPVAVKTTELTERGLCFIAVDTSGSMNLKDMPGSRTRWDCAVSLFGSHQADLDKLNEQCELHRYEFDAAPREVAQLPGEGANRPVPAPAGTSTDIVALLDKLAAESGGSATSGALLISDGRHNLPTDVVPAAQMLGRAGVPLYVVGVGQDATPSDYKDVSIKQLIVPEKAFVGGRTILRVEVESTVKTPHTVPLTVEIDGKKIFETDVRLLPGNSRVAPEVEVPYIPDSLGLHRAVATVGNIPDESNLLNNTATAFFRVYRTKIGVWYVEGAVRKEFGAIRSALETAPNVNFKAINAFAASMTGGGNASDLLPTRLEDWAQLRLVIIGDLPAVRFDVTALKDLARFVDDGGSILMIGGLSNFGAGGWQNSPLAESFPVEMSASDGMENGPLAITPVIDEMDHTPILNVGDNFESGVAAWRDLPPLPGVNRISSVRPAAHVLLRAGRRELLVVQEAGKGRSAVFTADMTWQWILKANKPEVHRRFWRNLVTWLTRSDYRDAAKAVFADAERLQYQIGEEAVFRAHVSSIEKLKEQIKTARIVLSLSRLQGAAEIPVFQEGAGTGPGDYSKHFALGAPGSYRFKAAAVANGQTLDSDTIDLQVTAPDIETDNPRANLRLLHRIAELSGGKYFDYAQAGQAFDALLARPIGFSKPSVEVVELWNSGWVLSIFMSLLIFEWWLRKKMGLI
jgi:hypothetical protein